MSILDGMTAIVTGATRGVGRGCAVELAVQGATVYITGRTVHEGDSKWPGSLESTIAEAKALGGTVIGVVCDHRKDDEVAALFEQVQRERGRLDAHVNNAFLIPDDLDPKANFWDTKLDCWDDMHQVGARSAYVGTWFAAKAMLDQRKGLIANISSHGARYFSLHAAYGAAKAALDRTTRDTGYQLEPYGIATVSIWPSFVTTERLLALDPVEWDLDLEGAESPRFTGRGVAALLCDENLMAKSGRAITTRQLADEYGFVDVDGKLPSGAADPGEPSPLLAPE